MSFLLRSGECAAVVGGKLAAGSGDVMFSGVSIDSRRLPSGALFVALRGPRFDGHDFLDQAFAAGAAGAVVSRAASAVSSRVLIEVNDTAEALLRLAAHRRRTWGGKLAAVTGSAGKTTTKEMLAHLLTAKFKVHRSPGNFNNLYGLSQALLGLEDFHEAAVVELGMSARGEIARLAAAAAPDLGILTNVEPVHLEFFSSIDEIAEAKGELVDALSDKGALVYNADDARVAAQAARHRGPKVSFGTTQRADFQATGIEAMGLDSSRFVLNAQGKEIFVQLPLPGLHNVYNFLGAVAGAAVWGMEASEIAERASGMRTAEHRGTMLRFHKGFTVIDDVYNSNPSALRRMIEQLAATPGFRRRLLVAGEMLELGADSRQLHAQAGGYAARLGLDEVVGVQGEARALCAGAAAAGMSENRLHYFDETDEAADFLAGHLQSGDLVLMKASRGVHLEKIIERLRAVYALEGGTGEEEGREAC